MKPTVVLVGIGRFGRNHIRVLKGLEKEGLCTVYGVVDTRTDVLENIRELYDVRTSKNLDDFLLDDVDAVSIVTPTNTHYTICKKCLAAGKHVFVEKPLTQSYSEAKALLEMAKQHRKTLMVGHIFRYNSAIWKIKELIENGNIGEVYYMFGHFMGLKDPRLDTGALFNFTVHHIDIYNYLLDHLPEEVTCCVGYYLGRRKFEDVAVLILKYPTGTLGVIEGSWLPPQKVRDLTIVGSKGSIVSNLLEQTVELHKVFIVSRKGELKAVDEGLETINLEFEEPLRLELLDFIECIKTGKKPLANDRVAVDTIKVAEKALESARLKRSVRINEDA